MNAGVFWSVQQGDSGEDRNGAAGGGQFVHPARTSASGGESFDDVALHTKLDELSNQLNAMVSAQSDMAEHTAPRMEQPAPTAEQPAPRAERAPYPPASQPTSAPQPEQAMSSSEPSTKSLIERIEQNERASSMTMDALNAKLSELGSRLQSLQEEKVAPEPAGDPKPQIDSAINKVLTQVEEAEKRNRDLMKTLQDRMAELGARAAATPEAPVNQSAPAIQALERRLAELHEKLDQKEQHQAEDPRLQSLESKLEELAQGLEALPSSVPQTEDVPAAAQYLADRIAAGEQPFNAATRDDLGRVERRMDELAKQMSTALARPNPAEADAARLRQDLANVSEQVRQIKASAASNRDVQSMRSSLENLTKVVSQKEDSYPLDALHQRINELAHTLQTSLPSAADQNKASDLEAKILQLDARLAAAQAQPDNTMAVKALEAQVKQVADRLGEQERRFAALGQIEASIAQLASQVQATSQNINHSAQKTAQLESSIAQLTSRLQVTRNEASSSAESAAQRMAEQLRLEVEAKTAQQAATQAPVAELAALQQGLQAVQTQAQSADRKTQDTLVAVHDTLDSVIERMNQIEAAKAAVAAAGGGSAMSPDAAMAAVPVAPEVSDPAQSLGALPTGFEPPAAVQPENPALTQMPPLPDATPEPAAVPGQAGAFAAPQLPAAADLNGAPAMQTPGPLSELNQQPALGGPLAQPAPVRSASGGSRQDFIAAAREAARAAGHTQGDSGPGGKAPSLAMTPGALGAAGQGNAPRDGKQGKNKLLIAGVLALLIGAATGYGVLNFSGNSVMPADLPSSAAPAPAVGGNAVETAPASAQPSGIQPAETAPLDGTAPLPGAAAPATEETGTEGVQPAESVPFDPTAPAESSSLQGGSAIAADPIQTGSVTNLSGKSGKASGSQPGFVPSNKRVDPNITAIGKTGQSQGGSNIEALTQLSGGGSSSDPFVTGSIPNAATASADTGTDNRSASELIASAGLPRALGPEGMLAAAVKGDKVAQFMVAARYSDGKAVPKDFDKAAKWYHKAASKGLAPAQYRLGTLYERGRGVKKDLKTAKSWYEHAAHRGHIKAMHNIAVLLANGMNGQPQFSQAAYWFKKAANFGLKDSQYNLAILYQQGLGVQKDDTEAYRWYALASKQKDRDAGKRLKALAKKMSPETLQKAKQLAESWRPVRAKFAANVVTPPIGGWEAEQTAKKPAAALALAPLPGDAVKQAQKMLNAIGFDAGVADGVMGPQTAKAIRTFQKQEGMAVTGKVSPALLHKLRNVPG